MVMKNQEAKTPLKIISKILISPNSLVRMSLLPAFTSRPSQELLAMATYLQTQFARFLKVLANLQPNPSMTSVPAKLLYAADVFIPIS
jgi:hypothetical protein